MPNTKPVCSSAAQAAQVEQAAAQLGVCDANQTVSITENFDGVSIDHLKTLPSTVKFITEDGRGVQDNATMAKVFAICTKRDITVMSHAEDMETAPGITAWQRIWRRCGIAGSASIIRPGCTCATSPPAVRSKPYRWQSCGVRRSPAK